MNATEFDELLQSRIDKIKGTLGNKAKEYAIGDRLYNFKRAAQILRTSPQKALLGMLMKHLVSVMDLIEGSLPPTEYLVDEKLGDTINYLILLEAIFKEKVTIKNPDGSIFLVGNTCAPVNTAVDVRPC